MSTFSGFGLLGLVALPVLICQWIGVLGLRKCERRFDWWCMLVGTAMVTLGSVLQLAYFMGLAFTSGSGTTYFDWVVGLMIATAALSGVGSLSFAIGFAIHGSRHSRISQRVTELEMMNLAQATELERLRNR